MTFKAIPVVAATLSLSTFSVAALAQSTNSPERYYHGPGMMWGGDYWGGFGMILGPIFMILLLVGLVAGTFLVLRALGLITSNAGSMARTDAALSILKDRYARGEIDSKEFEERKRLLVD